MPDLNKVRFNDRIAAEDPLVSVIVRTANRPKLLDLALLSIRQQTYNRFEVLVFNHGRDPATASIIDSHCISDQRFFRYDAPDAPSHITLLNIGIEKSKGDFVSFLDDDDQWYPDKLRLQVSKFRSNNSDRVALVTAGVVRVDPKGEVLEQWVPSLRGDVFPHSLGSSGRVFGPPSAVLVRRSVFDRIGLFREEMPRGAGQELFRRIARLWHIDFVDSLCVQYLMQPRSITFAPSWKSFVNSADAMEIKISVIKEDLHKYPSVFAQQHALLGVYQLVSLRLIRAATSLGRALWANPRTALVTTVSKSLQIVRTGRP